MFVQPGMRQSDRSRPLVVRAPNRRVLSPAGEEVPETDFWMRRLRDKDVVLAMPVELSPALAKTLADGAALDAGLARPAAAPAADAHQAGSVA